MINQKPILLFLILFLLVSCDTATERWLNGMTDFKEFQGATLSMQIMKVKPPVKDTTALTYKVRLFPAKDWVETRSDEQKTGLSYGMDSCFSLRAGNKSFKPAMVQPVNNGIANCFEYLLSFDVSAVMKVKDVQLIYKDKYIDGKQYILILN